MRIWAIQDKVTPEMEKAFKDRTNAHIKLVQKYCEKIADLSPAFEGIIEAGSRHDESKFHDPEYEPYVWINWRYKLQDEGVELQVPEEVGNRMKAATEHHILYNDHHPEYWGDLSENLLNEDDRDGIPEKALNASEMSDLAIAHMCADWAAMSEERGNTPQEWADKTVGKRWEFSEHQEELIYRLLDAIW
jgi:hypothetical protein